MHLLVQTCWGDIWKHTVEKSQTNASNVRPFEDTFENAQWKKASALQCDFTSSRTDMLRTHLKTHSGEKLNKCNQCKYASSRTDTRLVSEPECLKSHKCVCHSKIRAFGLHIFSLSLCLHLWLSIRLGSNNRFFPFFSCLFTSLFVGTHKRVKC